MRWFDLPDPSEVRERRWALSLFGLASIYFLPLAPIGLDPYDEGIRLIGAECVLAGELPYQDFYALYGPAQFYMPAILFSLFGARIIVLRAAILLFNALGASAIFCYCRRAGLSPSGSLLAYLLFLMPRTDHGAQLYFCDPALTLLLLAGTLLNSGAGVRSGTLIGGLLIGGATLFRQDFGLYGLVSALAAILCVRDERATSTVRRLGLLLLGTVGIVVPCYLALAFRGVQPLLDCLIRYPAIATSFRRLPYPLGDVLHVLCSLRWPLPILVFLGPPITIVLLLGLVSRSARRQVWKSGRRRAALVYAGGLALGLGVYGFGRCDFSHLFPAYAACICLSAILIRCYLEHLSPRITGAGAAVGIILVWVSFGTMVGAYMRCHPVSLDKALGIVEPSLEGQPLISAATDLRGFGGHEPVFVGSSRHDRVFINPLTLYFLAGRLPGTYFAEFDPGITTSAAAQRRIASDLRKNRIRLAIIFDAVLPDEPNMSRFSSRVRVLDEFLSERYSAVLVRPWYSIFAAVEGLDNPPSKRLALRRQTSIGPNFASGW